MLPFEVVQSLPVSMMRPKLLIPTDVDAFGRWRMWDIFSTMQRLTGEHADAIGSGSRDLAKAGFAWILGRVKVIMHRLPRCGDTVCMTTWPGVPRRFIYPRHYDMRDEEGQPIGSAVIIWVVLDIAKRRATTLHKGNIFYDIPDDTPEMPYPSKLRLPENWSNEAPHPVGYSDLDNNGHVNNLRYVDWVLDRLPWSHYRDHVLQEFQIDYSAELLPDMPLTLGYSCAENELVAAGHSDGKVKFSARGMLRAPIAVE